MSDKPKILISGDVDGNFKTLYNRVNNINKKNGPFEFLICVGNFFGSDKDNVESLKNLVNITTYIIGPVKEEHVSHFSNMSGFELCPNLYFLGKRGLYTTSSGLKIAYISGIEKDKSDAKTDFTFDQEDVETVKNICVKGNPSYRGTDILISSCWPSNILHSKTAPAPESPGSQLLSWLAAQIKPRYHFCGLEGLFYERPPYKNYNSTETDPLHATRFLAMAKVGNPTKAKWIYALNLEPIDKMKPKELYQLTTDLTECPYKEYLMQKKPSGPQEKPKQFFYDMSPPKNRDNQRKRKYDDQRKEPPKFDQEKCWFCLSSPQVEKHMVVTVGTEIYLALAKGGMVSDHLLILPVGHHRSSTELPPNVLEEINKFKKALTKFYASKGKSPIFFERNYKSSHLQIQVIPVKSGMKDILKPIFLEYAESQNLSLDELPDHAKLDDIAPPGTPFFYVELPSEERLFHRVRKNFPLNFGREILASSEILDMEDRIDWRDCMLSSEEETSVTQNLRKEFEPFDCT